ncbi:MAG: hypothetical protein IJ793_02640 [Opitutales bacterium]|nr:hypothetical protein [Opitutales bacterium]
MLSSVSSANSLNVSALNTASLLAQVREARKASLIDRVANAVDPATNAVDPTYVRALYNACDLFFNGNSTKVGLVKIEELLKNQLNAVLSLISSVRTYDFPLDIAKILDENKLTNACKKGNEAYKFYVRKIISELNNLHEVLTSAKNNLSQLQTLIRTGDFENPAVKELLTQLRLAELDGEAIKKTFSEYMVPKNFEITYFDIYWYNGKPAQTKTASTAKSALQTPEGYTMPEATEIDWDDEKSKSKFPSRIPDDISSVDDLRSKIKTDKLTGSRKVYTCYFQKGSNQTKWTDRYDTNADVYYLTQEKNIETDESPLSFFGELPLLDKLKYIVLYYTNSGTRRTFPENDAVNGFPCLPNPPVADETNPATGESQKYTDDVNEIARLEPFYTGFLVDRDGPVNALASFMEIKSAAIGEQIKILGYRIKALRYYLRFLNRGLEEVNKSQSNGNARIPNSAYETLAMVGCNPTRCLKTLTVNGVTKDYMVLQFGGKDKDGTKQGGTTGDKTIHNSPNDRYLLVPADDEGINAFVAGCSFCDFCYDRIFTEENYLRTDGDQPVQWGYMTRDEYNEILKPIERRTASGKIKETIFKMVAEYLYDPGEETAPSVFKIDAKCKYKRYARQHTKGKSDWSDWYAVQEEPHECTRKDPEIDGMLILKETDESKLPRELETNRMNITALLNENHYGNTWNNYKDASIWPSIVKNWTTTYDTVIGNVQAQLESVNKSIESLRNKINTFDESAMNFRNKAYTIYNKTVNNIE